MPKFLMPVLCLTAFAMGCNGQKQDSLAAKTSGYWLSEDGRDGYETANSSQPEGACSKVVSIGPGTISLKTSTSTRIDEDGTFENCTVTAQDRQHVHCAAQDTRLDFKTGKVTSPDGKCVSKLTEAKDDSLSFETNCEGRIENVRLFRIDPDAFLKYMQIAYDCYDKAAGH